MARYYTLCEFTPSAGHTYSRRSKCARRIYPNAPSGFVFHDTEKPLSVTDILRPMFRLTNLAEDSKSAVILRVDEQTLAGTLTLRGLPVPAIIVTAEWTSRGYEQHRSDWLLKNKLTGWVVPNLFDPSIPPIPFDTDIYDNCDTLVRLAGKCPCAEHPAACLAVARKALPQLNEISDTADYLIEPAQLNRAQFKQLNGFTLIPGGATSRNDFYPAVRPFDEHDFTIVEPNLAEYNRRGSRSAAIRKKRATECSNCALNPSFSKCILIHSCFKPVTDKDLEQHLTAWYEQIGFDPPGDFSEAERDYLIRHGGTEVTGYVFSSTRKTKLILGGFHRHLRGWSYRVSANAGDKTRNALFRTYEDLREKIPELPKVPEAVPVPTPEKVIYAILAMIRGERGSWGSWRHVHRLVLVGDRVDLYLAQDRYNWSATSLWTDTPLRDKFMNLVNSDYSFAMTLLTV